MANENKATRIGNNLIVSFYKKCSLLSATDIKRDSDVDNNPPAQPVPLPISVTASPNLKLYTLNTLTKNNFITYNKLMYTSFSTITFRIIRIHVFN